MPSTRMLHKTAMFPGLLGVLLALCVAMVAAEEPATRSSAPTVGPATAPATQPATAPAKSLVPGRMVCSEACKAKLDLANGLKKCSGGCGEMCNMLHKMCTKCATTAGVCEVCGNPLKKV